MGGPKDEAEWRRLYGLAAAQGLADAQCRLADMFYDGHGGPKDEVEARRLYGLAAAQGHADAQCNLAYMLYTGQGAFTKTKAKAQAGAKAATAAEAQARTRAAARAEAEAKAALAEAEEHARNQMEQEAKASAAKAQAAKEAATAEEPPDDFICPITHNLMIDPVSAADGHMYERRAITDWLVGHSTSPMTGAELEVKMLFPSHTVRRQIRSRSARGRRRSDASQLVQRHTRSATAQAEGQVGGRDSRSTRAPP